MIQLDSFDATRLQNARDIVRGLSSVLVAYSGGVDSTLLLKLAMDELGEGAVAVLASSPAYPESEQQAARSLAQSMGARLVEVTTDEVELEAYARNNPDRCFHCKEELFETLEPLHPWRLTRQFPPVNLYDAGERYVLTAQLPGMSLEDLDLTITGEDLTKA